MNATGSPEIYGPENSRAWFRFSLPSAKRDSWVKFVEIDDDEDYRLSEIVRDHLEYAE